MRKKLFFIFCGLLVAVLTVFLTAQLSAYNSNKVGSATKDSFSSPAASDNYLRFGKMSNSQSPSIVAKTILEQSSSRSSLGIVQYRSTYCSTGCSTGCSNGCSYGCSSGCSSGCSVGCSVGCN
jgi:hypothetical protein